MNNDFWRVFLECAIQIGAVLVLAIAVEARSHLHKMIKAYLDKVELEKYNLEEEKVKKVLDAAVDMGINLVEEYAHQYGKAGKTLDFNKLDVATKAAISFTKSKGMPIKEIGLVPNDIVDLIHVQLARLRRSNSKDVVYTI